MPFPSALDSGQYTQVRGNHYAADELMLLCSNTVVFAARINGAPTGDTYAQVTFDTVTTGAYTDVFEGMTVYISRDNTLRNAYFRGRVRLDGSGNVSTSTVLYINETSEAIADNDYLFVVRDFALHPKLVRVVRQSETSLLYYKDYNQAYADPAPCIYGLQSAYAGVVSGSPAGFTVSFAAQAVAVESGDSISGYAWTLPSGTTVTAGATNTANVTVRFDAAASEYWVRLVVTSANGRTTTRWIPVWAIPANLSTTIAVGFEGSAIEGSLDNGFTASVTAFEDVDDLLDQTLCVILSREYYDGDEGSIVTPVKFVGRIRRDTSSSSADEQASRVLSAQFEIEGMAAQLTRVLIDEIKMVIDATPTVWDEIANLTPWRAICHLLREHTTFMTVCSLSFSDTSNTYLYPSFPTGGGSVMDTLRDILESFNGWVEWAASGEARVVRDLRYATASERDAAPVVADFDAQDFIDITVEHQHVDEVGLITAYGGTYSTSTEQVIPVAAKWPGVTQAEGFARDQWNRQVMAANLSKAGAQAELRRRIGYRGALLNTRDSLTVVFPDQYNWIIPSVSQWYTFSLSLQTLAESGDNLRWEFDTNTRWLCETVSVQHDHSSGSKTVQATFTRETESTDGRDYEPPVSGDYMPSLPGLPGFNVYPAFPDLPIILPDSLSNLYAPPFLGPTSTVAQVVAAGASDGSVLLALTDDGDGDTRLFITRTGLLARPTWVEITPPLADGETIRYACFTRFDTGVYCLAATPEESRVYYCENGLAAPPTWTANAAVEGIYTQLRTTDTPGEIYILGATLAEEEEGEWEVTLDFTLSSYGFSVGTHPQVGAVATAGRWVAGQGWQLAAALYRAALFITSPTFSPITLFRPDIIIYYDNSDAVTLGGSNFSDAKIQVTRSNSTTDLSGAFTPSPLATGTGLTAVGTGLTNAADVVAFSIAVRQFPGSVENGWAPTYITGILIRGTGPNPFATSGFGSRFSDDFGATFEAVQDAGDPPGEGSGIATEKIGTSVLVGTEGQVVIATSKGGAYSAYGSAMPTTGQPTALFVPYRTFGSNTVDNINDTTPEYLVASAVLSDDDESLWRVTASGATFTDITPLDSGTPGVAVGPESLAMHRRNGFIILAIMSFDGTRRLARSLNTGTTWLLSAALEDEANCIRTLTNDKNNRQVWFANGIEGVGYIKNCQTSLAVVNKSVPSSAPVVLIDVYG